MAQFNDTSNNTGLVQRYEMEIGANLGDISSSTAKLKVLTADINAALDKFKVRAIRASGTFQDDDSNHTDYPILTTNLVSSQRDYAFTTDEDGNYILDIFKVLVANSSGVFSEITPIDAQSEEDTAAFWNGQNTTGTPTRYDKTGNGIFLDPIPSYNYTNGLKLYFNRTSSYFAYTDTTKRPGIPPLFHDYLVLDPALAHARRNNRPNYQTLAIAVAQMEQDIDEYYARRNRDERKRLIPATESNK